MKSITNDISPITETLRDPYNHGEGLFFMAVTASLSLLATVMAGRGVLAEPGGAILRILAQASPASLPPLRGPAQGRERSISSSGARRSRSGILARSRNRRACMKVRTRLAAAIAWEPALIAPPAADRAACFRGYKTVRGSKVSPRRMAVPIWASKAPPTAMP
ncbi:MAG: hypothetical protein ACO33A_14555 [Hyphomonas sp.]